MGIFSDIFGFEKRRLQKQQMEIAAEKQREADDRAAAERQRNQRIQREAADLKASREAQSSWHTSSPAPVYEAPSYSPPSYSSSDSSSYSSCDSSSSSSSSSSFSCD